ncbi:acyltransferase domain-containing protein [Corynebacterium sp. TAE3-ERU12]|uniref:acyltransferase domain-containing protein n=1 Tax=Corynebacterium sp. TAE3-ERU12 TaxID=2849491 RepID=UPI001C48D063|nr:acyltransferase domain-containing protein [Corynebacterium sp. TAE3-ERU12]MBV7294658.1 acyltransferase domain-containing protein [Corynebacterium sp. TAE3-ERU12]
MTAVVVLPARNPELLRRDARRLLVHLSRNPGWSPADIAAQIQATWPPGPTRAAITADTPREVLDALHALALGKDHPALSTASAARDRGRVIAVFPGQGQQRPGLLRPLYDGFNQVRMVADEQAECFRAEHGIDIAGYLLDPSFSDTVDETIIQPALFTQMLAIAELWRDHGLQPDATLGHSQGEIAAAAFAKLITAKDARMVVATRARMVSDLPGGPYGMAVLGVDDRSCRTLIAPWAGDVDIAVHNAPTLKAIAGTAKAVGSIVDKVVRDGGFARYLPVGYAAHTSAVDAVRERFTGVLHNGLAHSTFASGELDCLSSALCGAPIHAGADQTTHWYANLRNPVRFDDAITGIGAATFIEMSAMRTLDRAITATLNSAREHIDAEVIVTSPRSEPASTTDWSAAYRVAIAEGLCPCPQSPALSPANTRDFPAPSFNEDHLWWTGSLQAPDATPSHENESNTAPKILQHTWLPLPALPQSPPRPVIVDPSTRWASSLIQACHEQGLEIITTADGNTPVTILCSVPPEARETADAIDLLTSTLEMLPKVSPGSQLTLLTTGATSASAGPRIPGHAACVPIAASFAASSGYRFRHIDIPDPEPTSTVARAAAAAVQARDSAQISIGKDATFVPRLTLLDVESPSVPAEALRHVLVTGGRGQVAGHVVASLISLGAERITVVSRDPSAFSPELAAMARSAEIPLQRVYMDLMSDSQLPTEMPDTPVSAVIHTAATYPGDTRGETIEQSTRLRAKALEHLLTRIATTSDCTVIFSSSIAVTLSHPDTASYAAAVAAAETLAELHPNWRIIRWGIWPGTSNSTGFSSVRAADAGTGLLAMDPEEALSCALRAPTGITAVLTADWALLDAAYAASGSPNILDPTLLNSQLEQESPAEELRSGAPTAIADSSPKSADEVEETPAALCARVLGYPATRTLDLDTPLPALGLTSLQAIELRGLLANRGIKVLIADLLSTTTIRDIEALG